MKIKLPFALLLISSFSFFAAGQDFESGETPSVVLPDNVMQQVVSRILVWKFKPAVRPKTVFIAQNLVNQAWLPSIKNIEFRLLSDDEVQDRDEGVYFFTKPEISEKNYYQIGLGFGNPDCDYSGEVWYFRVIGNKIRLWGTGNMGGGCSGDGFMPPGKINTFPNELKGYEFFDRERLKGVRLTVSTREDIKNIFGEECETACDYDENWRINFSYFDNHSREITSGEKKTRYVPDPEYADKLYSFSLSPKSTILFDKIVFPPRFRQSSVYTAAHDGMGGGTNSVSETYTDRYGLIYVIFDKITLTTKKEPAPPKGKLIQIQYTIPDELEKKMFVEEK